VQLAGTAGSVDRALDAFIGLSAGSGFGVELSFTGSNNFIAGRDVSHRIWIGEMADSHAMAMGIARDGRIQFDGAKARFDVFVVGIIDALQAGVNLDLPGLTGADRDAAGVGQDIHLEWS